MRWLWALSLLSASQLRLFVALNIVCNNAPFGVRLDYSKLSKIEFDEIQLPVLLCNILTEEDSDSFTYSLMKNLKNELIEYDVRRDDQIESYECTLEEFISTVSDNSDHEDNMYLMNEAILDKLGQFADKVTDILVCIRENKLFGYEDMFQYFPSNIKPSNALIIGGIGARSFLHADPYDWVGVNYLFEGEKLWTFVPPSKEVEDVLQVRRNSPDAWDPTYSIAAGYVSDVDLYKTCTNYSIKSLVNNKELVTSTINRKYIAAAKQISSSSPYLKLPMFETGNDAVDKSAALGDKVVQLIQKPGDLVVIPPHWYHQVYHLQPSIAVASQYMNEIGSKKCFEHILDWCSTGKAQFQGSQLQNEFGFLSNKMKVQSVIKSGLVLKYGQKDGLALYQTLTFP